MRVEFEHVSKAFGRSDQAVPALNDMTFEVRDGEFLALIGPSGCGKSTTLRLISGLDAPTTGVVQVDGRRVNGPSSRVGFMLQKDLLLPWRTVIQNVTIGLEMQSVPRRERIDRARAFIHKYGLGRFENSYPKQLSGGMRQRVALARTLAFNPELLLLDEPLSALDFQTKLKMEEELVRILINERKTVLLITHDIAEAISVADRVLVCSARPGSIKAEFVVPFPKGHSPLAIRSRPEFPDLFQAIWRELESDVTI